MREQTRPTCVAFARQQQKAKGPQVALDWNDPNCVDAYDVIVNHGSTTGTKAFKKKNLSVSEVITTALTKGQTYYWRVTAKNAFGKSNSEWRAFKVK